MAQASLVSSKRFIDLTAFAWTNNTVRVVALNFAGASFDLAATLSAQVVKRWWRDVVIGFRFWRIAAPARRTAGRSVDADLMAGTGVPWSLARDKLRARSDRNPRSGGHEHHTRRGHRIMDTELLNKAIVGRWFSALWGEACDLRVVDELAAPTIRLQYSLEYPRCGRQAVKDFMIAFRSAFPDLCFRKIGGLIADRDIVVVRWEGSGTHTGPAYDDFHIGPFPAASGRRIVLCGHSAVRLEDEMIAEEAVWSTQRKVKLRAISGGLVF